jgi:hypothetical protein
MTSANYATSNTPHLTITCHNDLTITGGSEPSVEINIDAESPANRIDRNGETITVMATDLCDVTCPTGTSITIELVSGDLRVTQIKGTLAINVVNGDATLRDSGPAEVQAVQGDLSVRDIDGDLRVGTVRGDAKVKRVSGQFTIENVSGDLMAHDLARVATAGNVGGDASLEIEFEAGQTYSARAGGDIVLRIDGGGATFALNAGGDIRSRVPMTNWQGNGQQATGTLGDGSAKVTLMAGGDILILPGKTGFFDPEGLSDQVESLIESAMGQFESQMTRVQRELEERWGKGSSVEKAAERAKRSAERAKRRAERAAETWGTFFSPGRPPSPPAPPDEPVSDQERLMVLKMVEEGKLSVEEASKLLAAMEG